MFLLLGKRGLSFQCLLAEVIWEIYHCCMHVGPQTIDHSKNGDGVNIKNLSLRTCSQGHNKNCQVEQRKQT